MENGNSFKEIDEMDANNFLDYLQRISSNGTSNSGAQMMSADDFYKNF